MVIILLIAAPVMTISDLDIDLPEAHTRGAEGDLRLNITLDEALKQESRLTEMSEKQPEVADLINISRVLEGLPRHASTHAAGTICF